MRKQAARPSIVRFRRRRRIQDRFGTILNLPTIDAPGLIRKRLRTNGDRTMLLKDRLSLLTQIMLDHQLNSTAKTICWFLLCERMNEHTGQCNPSDQDIADNLGIDRSNVVRAKRILKDADILHCKRTPSIGANLRHFSSYRFNTRFVARKRATQRSENAPIHRRENASIDRRENAPIDRRENAPTTNKPPSDLRHGPLPNGKFFAEYDTPEWDYWDAFLRKTTGTGAARGNRGKGWLFPSQWPKENVQ